MTMEQFDRARELYDEKEFVARVEGLFMGWTTREGKIKNKIAMVNPLNPNDVYDSVEGFSSELQNRLVKTCRNYYNELTKEFNEV